MLLSCHTAASQAATVHPFLAGVRDGSLPEDCFDRWLAQDYLFAQALVRAQSRIAATAPLADVGLLAGGVVATVGELGWFEEMAARRGLALDAAMHPATRAYCDFLLALTYSGYPAQITAIWALERTYLEKLGQRPPRCSALPGLREQGGPRTGSGPTSATSRVPLIASSRPPSANRPEKLKTPSSG
jgi:thiaminase/transcriptional activator TenA